MSSQDKMTENTSNFFLQLEKPFQEKTANAVIPGLEPDWAVIRLNNAIEWERKAALFLTYFLLFARMPQQAQTFSAFLWSTFSAVASAVIFYHTRPHTKLVQVSTIFICMDMNYCHMWWSLWHHSNVCLTSVKWYWNTQDIARTGMQNLLESTEH